MSGNSEGKKMDSYTTSMKNAYADTLTNGPAHAHKDVGCICAGVRFRPTATIFTFPARSKSTCWARVALRITQGYMWYRYTVAGYKKLSEQDSLTDCR